MRAQAWVRGAVARLMTPFNCPAAHASSSPYHLLLLPSSSYSLLSRLRRHFASSSSSRSSSPGQSPRFLSSFFCRARCSSFCRTRVLFSFRGDSVAPPCSGFTIGRCSLFCFSGGVSRLVAVSSRGFSRGVPRHASFSLF